MDGFEKICGYFSKFGVKIVTELIALIQMLEPFSKHHKDIYWRFLKV